MIEGIRWAGERAFLVEFSTLDEVIAFAARAQFGQTDRVPAARTVLVTFQTRSQALRAAARASDVDLTPVAEIDRRIVDIDVVYDGEDLADVASLTGLSPEAVVAAHTASEWVAAFGGFAPGFAYLTGGDPRLRVPRRDSPRPSVPAGSVALAGEFSAIYPRRSPGGWRLIGRTDAALWDPDRDEPALIRQGDAVRFRAVRATVTAREDNGAAPAPHGEWGHDRIHDAGACAENRSGLEVISTGPLSLIEDLGRPGHASIGVTSSGAADPASARQANRLVGNARDAAVVESLLGGLAVRAVGDQVVALAGADADAVVRTRAAEPEAVDADEAVAPGSAFLLRDGETLVLGAPAAGLRTYLALRGGIDAQAVLGSRATDALSGTGPDSVRPGQLLRTGALAGPAIGAPEPSAVAFGWAAATARATPLRIVFGPRDDWFDASERAHLLEAVWTVGMQSDRVGIRLEPRPGGRPLRVNHGDLPSEGLVTGAIQVPPSGEPVLFGPDHPVTGGYPVIAVVIDADLPLAAQLRPGSAVRFVEA